MWENLNYLTLAGFMISGIITVPQIISHLVYFNKPQIQSNCCKILILIPLTLLSV